MTFVFKPKHVIREMITDWFLEWKKLRPRAFFEEFRRKMFYGCLAVLGAFLLFATPLRELMDWSLVKPALSKIPDAETQIDVVFIVFALVTLVFILRKIHAIMLPSIHSILLAVTALLIYYTVFKDDSKYEFYHFHCSWLHHYTYSTVFLFCLIPLTLSYKRYFQPLTLPPSRYSFTEDQPKTYKDLYDRSGYAKIIADHIRSTSTEHSFTIGVIGEWGAGKTDFNDRLKKNLRYGSDAILLSFNPWRVSKPDAIIDTFFTMLASSLKPYNHSIVPTIKEYSKKILQNSKEIQYRVIDAVLTEWQKDEDINTKYESINTAIRNTGKRLIIFIDDADRLTGKEVVEVLRLVRNSANFSNTFFIMGIDHMYIVKALRHSKEFSNEEEYLKKVFQFSITLPSFKKEIFVDALKNLLFTDDLTEEEKEKISGGLSVLSYDRNDLALRLYPAIPPNNHLEDMLDNLRDLKRFANSLKVVFNIIKDEADIHDMMILELIRNKNIDVYKRIRNKEFLSLKDNLSIYSLNTDKWDEFAEQTQDEAKTDLSFLKSAVEFLLSDSGIKNQRKFIYPYNFYIYFSYQLFGMISMTTFNETIKENKDTIINQFELWIKEKKEAELTRIITKMDIFPDAITLRKFVSVCLSIKTNDPNWLSHAIFLLHEKRLYNVETYFKKNTSSYMDFLNDLMEDNTIPLFSRISTAYRFLYELIKTDSQEEDYFKSKRKWQRIVYCLFDQYLSTDPLNFAEIDAYFRLNDYKRDGNFIILYPPAGRRLRRYLLTSNKALEVFTNNVLVQQANASPGYFQFRYWLIDTVFSFYQNYRSTLERQVFAEPRSEKIKKFVLSRIDDFYKDKRPFLLTDEEKALLGAAQG